MILSLKQLVCCIFIAHCPLWSNIHHSKISIPIRTCVHIFKIVKRSVTTFTLRHRPEYETEWMFEFIKNLSFGLPRLCQCIRPSQASKIDQRKLIILLLSLGIIIIWLWVFYRKLKHSYFPYFTSEDMKKYVTHGKHVCFPAGSPQLDLAPF